jgi:hypothetical protein
VASGLGLRAGERKDLVERHGEQRRDAANEYRAPERNHCPPGVVPHVSTSARTWQSHRHDEHESLAAPCRDEHSGGCDRQDSEPEGGVLRRAWSTDAICAIGHHFGQRRGESQAGWRLLELQLGEAPCRRSAVSRRFRVRGEFRARGLERLVEARVHLCLEETSVSN